MRKLALIALLALQACAVTTERSTSVFIIFPYRDAVVVVGGVAF